MKAAQTLRKPENWQDFESLCKKLWGEIWKCSEIKKNGRAGQNQHGVDVYGIPKDEKEYFGIQCKGKDEYTHKQLTVQEIDDEIKKAKSFNPKLKKFYFATTAVKDAYIEEIIRLRNIEHINQDIFEIHLFAWEDIVDLIEENKDTYNYYVKSINYKTSKAVAITFSNDSTELTIIPKFKKRIANYKQKIDSHDSMFDDPISKLVERIDNDVPEAYVVKSETKINYSYCKFNLLIKNTGDSPIEEYKLLFEFIDGIVELSHKNEETTGPIFNDLDFNKYDSSLDSNSMKGEIIPKKKILVGDDTYITDYIYLKPKPEENKIGLKWKLISKSFKQEGDLFINVKPDIETIQRDIYVDDPQKVRTEISDVEDYSEVKKAEKRSNFNNSKRK